MAQALMFGFSWLGDSATIQHIPLLNIMVMCGDVNPVVVSICDCTDHMSEGGKKDATYIAKMFQERVNEFDPKGRQRCLFLTKQQMFRRQAKFCVKPFPGHSAFMVGSMFCPSSSVTCQF